MDETGPQSVLVSQPTEVKPLPTKNNKPSENVPLADNSLTVKTNLYYKLV